MGISPSAMPEDAFQPGSGPSAQLLLDFGAVLGEHTELLVRRWSAGQRANLDEFKAFLQELQRALDTGAAEAASPGDIRDQLEQYCRRLLKHTDSYGRVGGDYSHAGILGSWTESFDDFLQDRPDRMRIRPAAGFWASAADDVVKVRLWKLFWRQRLSLSAALVRLAAMRPGKHEGEASATEPPSWEYSLHDFARFFVRDALVAPLLAEWQSLLHSWRLQVDELHAWSIDLCLAVLRFGEAQGEQPEEEGTSAVSEILTRIQDCIARVDAMLTAIDGQAELAAARVVAGWEAALPALRTRMLYAGTLILPPGRFGAEQQARQSEQQSKASAGFRKQWQRHFDGEHKDWNHDLVLIIIQLEAFKNYRRVKSAFDRQCSEQILTAFDAAKARIDASRSKLRNQPFLPQGKALQSTIAVEKHILLKDLREKLIPGLIDALAEARLESIVLDFIGFIKTQAQQLPQDHSVFRHRDKEGKPPESEVDTIPIRSIFEDKLSVPALDGLNGLQEMIRSEVEEVLRSVNNIDQVVEYNFDAALGVAADPAAEEIMDIAQEGLGRAFSGIERLRARIETLRETAADTFASIARAYLSSIQEVLNNEKLFELYVQLLRAQMRLRLRSYRRGSWDFVKKAVPRAFALLRNHYQRLREQYVGLRQRVGLEPESGIGDQGLLRYLAALDERLANLPYVYRHLFNNEALSDRRFFVDRDNILSGIGHDLRNWRNGYSVLTALVGESGSGRTSLLYRARDEVFKDDKLVEIDFKRRLGSSADLLALLAESFGCEAGSDGAAVIAAIQEREQGCVCMVENLQNLFIKQVDGFDLLEEFILIMQATRRKVFWLVTCSEQAWRYLDRVLQLGRNFQQVLFLNSLAPGRLQELIMKRHSVSGYHLEFKVTEEVAGSRRFRKLNGAKEEQQYLKEMFFASLHEQANGNIAAALLFWLKAIEKFEDDRIIVHPECRFASSLLAGLSDEEQFSLTALLQHGALSLEEHCRVLRLSERQGRIILNRLEQAGYLLAADDRYRIRPIVLLPLIKMLKRKNFIH